MISYLDLAVLSEHCYEGILSNVLVNVHESGNSWVRVRDYGSYGWGFFAVLYRNQQNEFVIAYRGTDGGKKDLFDFRSDIQLAVGYVPKQFKRALETFSEVSQGYGRPCILTGHSLGGGLAQMVGAEYDYPYVVFSAPSMKVPIARRKKRAEKTFSAKREVRSGLPKWLNIRLANDPVSSPLGRGKDKCETITLHNARSVDFGIRMSAHSMANVIEAIKSRGAWGTLSILN